MNTSHVISSFNRAVDRIVAFDKETSPETLSSLSMPTYVALSTLAQLAFELELFEVSLRIRNLLQASDRMDTKMGNDLVNSFAGSKYMPGLKTAERRAL